MYPAYMMFMIHNSAFEGTITTHKKGGKSHCDNQDTLSASLSPAFYDPVYITFHSE